MGRTQLVMVVCVVGFSGGCATSAVSDPPDANNLACTPGACDRLSCGTFDDGCGNLLTCGSCPDDLTCGGDGINRCGTGSCVADTCVSLGRTCGPVSDGCADILDCGRCDEPNTCGGGGVEGVCGCTPQCDDVSCGGGDGCGGQCPAPEGCCTDDCSEGQTSCDGAQIRSCGNFDDDPCLDWSESEVCEHGACVDDACPAACVDECSEAGVGCVDDDTKGTCGDFDADPCLEWGEVVVCEAERECAAGVCSSTCTDECSVAGIGCVDIDTRATCGNFDDDPCLEWDGASVCDAGQECSGGVCVSTCSDECSPAGLGCVDDSTRGTCGNFDADPCLEWGSVSSCTAGESCAAGVCVADCVDECAPAGSGCVSNTQTGVCGDFDNDSCLEWSAVTSCGGSDVCVGGVCECADECAVSGQAMCLDADTRRVCFDWDGDGCLERRAFDCAAGERCDAGTCVASCTDECLEETTRCVGDSVEECGNHDGDGCLEWGNATSCSGGTCVDGVCEGGVVTAMASSPGPGGIPNGTCHGAAIVGDDDAAAMLWGGGPPSSLAYVLPSSGVSTPVTSCRFVTFDQVYSASQVCVEAWRGATQPGCSDDCGGACLACRANGPSAAIAPLRVFTHASSMNPYDQTLDFEGQFDVNETAPGSAFCFTPTTNSIGVVLVCRAPCDNGDRSWNLFVDHVYLEP